jgi:hypothetical protein
MPAPFFFNATQIDQIQTEVSVRRTFWPWSTIALICAAAAALIGCQRDYERKHIGGKGSTIQLTWEEEQHRNTNRGMDRDGTPASLSDCEERAWINRRAQGLTPLNNERARTAGDTYRHVGQYAFRKRAGYGGSMSQPDQKWLLYAVIPDFSPQYHADPKLCDDSKVLRAPNGSPIDGSACRRYDVVNGVANLAAIVLQCVDRDHLNGQPDLYWPARLPQVKEEAFVNLRSIRLTGRPRHLVNWQELTRTARPELGLYEYTGHVAKDVLDEPKKPEQTSIFYEPMAEPKTWHLGQPAIFSCSKRYEKASADSDQATCSGPATYYSFVAPGLSAGMTFPIKFLPQWRELTRGFTEFVTSYQTTDPQAPLPFVATSSARR